MYSLQDLNSEALTQSLMFMGTTEAVHVTLEKSEIVLGLRSQELAIDELQAFVRECVSGTPGYRSHKDYPLMALVAVLEPAYRSGDKATEIAKYAENLINYFGTNAWEEFAGTSRLCSFLMAK